MADTSQYKVGIVLSVEEKKGGGKPLKVCSVNIGDEGNPMTVVTAASNVRQGSRCVCMCFAVHIYVMHCTGHY
jgi:tRNA-binding EMAP/Myf-like protein